MMRKERKQMRQSEIEEGSDKTEIDKSTEIEK